MQGWNGTRDKGESNSSTTARLTCLIWFWCWDYKRVSRLVEEAGLEDNLDPVALDGAYVSDDKESLSPKPSDEDLRQWESDWEERQSKGAQLSEGEMGETTPTFRQEPVLIDFLPEDSQTSEQIVYPDKEDKRLHNHAAELL